MHKTKSVIYMPYPNKPLYSVQRKLILEVPNSVQDYCLKNSCSCFQHCYSNRAMVNSKLYHLLIHCLLKLHISMFNSKNFELWVSV